MKTCLVWIIWSDINRQYKKKVLFLVPVPFVAIVLFTGKTGENLCKKKEEILLLLSSRLAEEGALL